MIFSLDWTSLIFDISTCTRFFHSSSFQLSNYSFFSTSSFYCT